MGKNKQHLIDITPSKSTDWDSIYEDEDDVWLPNDSDRKKKNKNKNKHTGLAGASKKTKQAELKYKQIDDLAPRASEGCCGGSCSFSLKAWRENIISNGNGERWLYLILSFEIIYFIGYMTLNYFNHRNVLIEYEIFVGIIVFMLVLGAYYFLRNVLYGYRIGEVTSFLVTVFSLNAYMVIRMLTTGVRIYQQETGNDENMSGNFYLLTL